MDEQLKQYISMIDSYLLASVSDSSSMQKSVIEAMKYSLTAGGKRIRPILTLEFARVLGCSPQKVLPYACAVEMIH